MTWKARVIGPDELASCIGITSVAFGVGPTPPEDYTKQVTASAEVDRMFLVEDGSTPVGTGGHFTFELAVPGGVVPMGGVTFVGVLPTHRRRGVLRSLMGALLDQAQERGEPMAGLTASEGGIYGRFGFGVATRMQTLSLAVHRAADALDAAAAAGGGFRMVAGEDIERECQALWARSWRGVPGEVSRTPGWWAMEALDIEHDRGGASARFAVVHEGEDGRPDGYALYRVNQRWGTGLGHELIVLELVAEDPAVEAALLRFLTEVDLVGSVTWPAAPLDHPLRWRLADLRALRITFEADHLWLRPLDVARCLSSRRYAATGGLVLQVVDQDRPELGGTFRLDAGPDGAACARTDVEPDLVLATRALGSAYLGGVSWGTLQRAGRVEERTPGAVATADTLFRASRPPYCGTDF